MAIPKNGIPIQRMVLSLSLTSWAADLLFSGSVVICSGSGTRAKFVLLKFTFSRNNYQQMNASPVTESVIVKDCPRISRTATFRAEGPIDKVFPLFGPVLEKEWCWGWNPEILYSTSPLIEEKMIFRTK